MRSRSIALLLICAGVTTGCEEDALVELYPRVLLCASEETGDSDCNRALDLGELHVGVVGERNVVVRNAGDALLSIESIISEPSTTAVPEPTALDIAPGESALVALHITAPALGDGHFLLVILSDDPDRPRLEVQVRFFGIPAPAPKIALCFDDDGNEVCAADTVVDFGTVRRTQTESRVLAVKNVGNAELEITDVIVTDGSSRTGELEVVTSTRPGVLPSGGEAPVIVRYAPKDGTADIITVAFATNDPTAPVATATFIATSDENAPPNANAVEFYSSLTTVDAIVGQVVTIDGLSSFDPEGDPLIYAWSLVTPQESDALLHDVTAGRVLFTPDVAGAYRVALTVTDSLGQTSPVPAVVDVFAIPEAALRATLLWDVGGDLDLHVVPAGDLLFGATDCHFANPSPDLGVIGATIDDTELLGDSESAPGDERVVLREPASGTYEIWVHYYAVAGSGPATPQVAVTLFDASFPSIALTGSLTSDCELWHVADVTFPDGLVVESAEPLSIVCP